MPSGAGCCPLIGTRGTFYPPIKPDAIPPLIIPLADNILWFGWIHDILLLTHHLFLLWKSIFCYNSHFTNSTKSRLRGRRLLIIKLIIILKLWLIFSQIWSIERNYSDNAAIFVLGRDGLMNSSLIHLLS